MKALFDTNILIDYLAGNISASRELEQYEDSKISIISKMEVLVGANDNNEEIIRGFLSNFKIIDINNEIAEIAIILRKKYKIRLPDAIIWATAKFQNCLLVTRDVKDFPSHSLDIKVPY